MGATPLAIYQSEDQIIICPADSVKMVEKRFPLVKTKKYVRRKGKIFILHSDVRITIQEK